MKNIDGFCSELSAQRSQVDCDKMDNGCDGGLPEQADKWLIAHHEGKFRNLSSVNFKQPWSQTDCN